MHFFFKFTFSNDDDLGSAIYEQSSIYLDIFIPTPPR